MYEPYWFREKAVAGISEALAVVTAAAGLVHCWWVSHGRAEQSR
jgi:hypothetical protein